MNRLAVAVLVLIWGTTWAAIRIGLEGTPPFTGVALRFALAGAVLLAMVPLFRVRLGQSRREVALWALNGLLSFSLSYGIVYWAEQRISSGLAAVLFATFPLFVAAFSHFWLPGERLTARSLSGTLIGFAGVAVIFSEDLSRLAEPVGEVGALGGGIAAAAGLFLVSPLVSAFANVATKRWGKGLHPLSITAVPMLLTGAVMGTLAALVEGDREMIWDVSSVGAILYLAIFGSAVTFSVYFWLLGRMPATRLSLITYAVPVVAVVTGTLFLEETLTVRVGIGAALVILGVALAVWKKEDERS
ncbi:MAG: EamA family transporter [Acidobacteriota bacterium]